MISDRTGKKNHEDLANCWNKQISFLSKTTFGTKKLALKEKSVDIPE